MDPGRLAVRAGFGDEQCGSRKVTTPDGLYRHPVQKERELVERAYITGELNLPDGDAPALVVPESFVRHGGDEAPPKYLVLGDRWAGAGGRGLSQHRRGGGRPVDDEQRKSIQHQIDQTRRGGRGGGGPGRRGNRPPGPGARPVPRGEKPLPPARPCLPGPS